MNANNTPPPIKIVYKNKEAKKEKKEKKKPRYLDDNDEPTYNLPVQYPPIASVSAAIPTEENIQMNANNTPPLPYPYKKKRGIASAEENIKLIIGEELSLEAEILPTPTQPLQSGFADASCQTDDLEIVCSNCCAPKLSRAEYHRQYNEKNKEKISEYKKKYRQENKDKINTDAKREYQRKYDAEHKEAIMARRNIMIDCECGEKVKTSSLAKHKMTNTHKLKVELRIAKGETVLEAVVQV